MSNAVAAVVLASLLCCTAVAAADVGAAQLGGDYAATISCDGTKLKATRASEREVSLVCKADTAATASLEGARMQLVSATNGVQLATGEQLVVRCSGKKLAVRRQTGTVLQASCVALPARSV
jgi:hypothetical protein